MESIEVKQNISSLLDIYGGLLTERQRQFIDMHYNEDLSYGEIAETENISRQAVHDTIQHGKKSLLRFEEELHLVSRSLNQEKSGEYPIDMEAVRREIDDLCRCVRNDIMYDTGRLKRKLKRLRELMGFGD